MSPDGLFIYLFFPVWWKKFSQQEGIIDFSVSSTLTVFDQYEQKLKTNKVKLMNGLVLSRSSLMAMVLFAMKLR